MADVAFSIPKSRSVFFDGVGDYLVLPSDGIFVFERGDFTIETWIYPTALGGYRTIAGPEYGTTGAALYLFGTSVTIFTTARIGETPSGSISLNVWQHIAVVRANEVLKIYINGVEQSSVSFTNNLTRTQAVIGTQADALGDESFVGYMSNLRVVKGIAIYTSNFTPPTEPLVPFANTSLLICQSSAIIDNSYNRYPITVFGNTRVDEENPFGVTTSTSVSAELFDDILTTDSIVNTITPTAKFVFDIYDISSSIDIPQDVVITDELTTNISSGRPAVDIADVQSSIDIPINAVGTDELTTNISSGRPAVDIADVQSSIDIPINAVGTDELTTTNTLPSQSVLQYNINDRNNFSNVEPIVSFDEAVSVSQDFLKRQVSERTSPQKINSLRVLIESTQTVVEYSYWI